MRSACNSVSLASLGVLRARGADSGSFLQGQLSNDVTLLGAERSLLAGYHNPQGRVIALLRLVRLASDDVLAILPRELVARVAQRLAKFILRAKVKLTDESAAWSLIGLVAQTLAPAADAPPSGAPSFIDVLPANVNGAARFQDSIAVRLAERPARWLLVSPAAQPPALPGCTAAAAEVWQRLAIAAGEPQVYAATCEEFVAQMLNLDALGAVAFDKGCYTGQEVIARAHYRGRVKRRLQRFVTREARALAPGAAGELADGRAFKVVDAVQRPDGRCEFLAVAPLAAEHAAAGEAPSASPSAAPRIDVEQLPLPYTLPP
jgi:tRNA-modifying protein YgfZ